MCIYVYTHIMYVCYRASVIYEHITGSPFVSSGVRLQYVCFRLLPPSLPFPSLPPIHLSTYCLSIDTPLCSFQCPLTPSLAGLACVGKAIRGLLCNVMRLFRGILSGFLASFFFVVLIPASHVHTSVGHDWAVINPILLTG